MDESVAKKYMTMGSLAQDLGWEIPKLTLGKKTCKCEILDKSGKIIFEGSGDKPNASIEECYKDLLKYIEKMEVFSPGLKN